ncbi:LPS assembly lipoprotein LptE [Sulfitobacter aestuarii]|uniref:LPS assembly lipoprotein LptE n=1 Tax=Sulfitobacter aestuarii TaxID=2161676 RepID=A0ABW5U269_9RHOB
MSSPDRPRLSRRLLLALPLVLTACGFEPVYGPGCSGSALQNRVSVEEPETRDGYILTREIETRLGRSSAPTYALALSAATRADGLNIDRSGNINRYNLLGSVDYALRDLDSGVVLASGKVENFTGYSTTGSTVATLAAETDARERLMTILADQIVARLLAADLAQ